MAEFEPSSGTGILTVPSLLFSTLDWGLEVWWFSLLDEVDGAGEGRTDDSEVTRRAGGDDDSSSCSLPSGEEDNLSRAISNNRHLQIGVNGAIGTVAACTLVHNLNT